ncbi:MAG: putative corrinoid protein [Ilumatobacteraceae bacterium]|nr:putative corrinoid protein [Ilumatobacteraceae bacterium]
MTASDLTLHEAATRLGVHYMTAYRYVRLGLLPARKVGGTWCVGEDDVAAFRDREGGRGTAQQAELDTASADRGIGEPRPGVGGMPGAGVARSGRLRAPWAERIEARLLAGDVRGAWSVVEAALAAGSSLSDVYLDVVTPALVSIGERWESGELDVSDEHRASGIVMRLIGRLGPRFARRGRSRGVVVLGCPAGEQHSLALAMVSDLLRQRGWEVSDLGSDLPVSSFVRAVTTIGTDLVAVGISVGSELGVVAETISAIHSASPGVPVVLGGGAITSAAHARSLGADHFAPSLDAILAVLEGLVQVEARRS